MDSMTGLTSSFKPMKGEPTSAHEFVKPPKAKADPILGIPYLDFQTYPREVSDITFPPGNQRYLRNLLLMTLDQSLSGSYHSKAGMGPQ